MIEDDGSVSTTKFIEFATTRPETMLGDTAVAVNPDDDRYKDLIGKKLLLPIVNRELPVIADSYVDMEFGTGVVKITPAHDPNDFEVGKRHNLPEINILNDDATINKNGGKFEGMDRYAARDAIVKELDEMGLLVRIEDYSHNVGTHDRCKTTIEPMIKQQWFVKMDELIKPAVEAVKNGDIELDSGSVWKRPTLTGSTISVTGVSAVSFGGDTGFRLITVMSVEKLWLPGKCRKSARSADAPTLHRIRIPWIRGFLLHYGRSQP